jgi:hypothetical protein
MSNDSAKNLVAVILFCLLAIFVFFGPIFTIWSLNTLFGLQIPVNFQTWVSVIWLITIFHGIKIMLRKDD